MILFFFFNVISAAYGYLFNTLRPWQNNCQFFGDNFKCIVLNENISISIMILMKFVFKGQINSIATLVQMMAWRLIGAIIWANDV